jgi:catechol 2,3-dioxygenase-like lactoylglutathione lyase family enzyme
MDLNQVTIEVLDFEASVAFYQRIGLRLIVSARGEYARFELPSGSSTLSLHQSDHPSIGGPLLYFEVDDVDAKYLKLTGLGVHFDTKPKDQSWLWREARFCDPSGNRLCLYHAGNDRRFPPWRIEGE